MNINVTQLKVILEPYLYPYLKKDNYEIKKIDAIDLLTSKRFDIAFKLFYLEMKKYNNIDIAKQIYAEHIKAFTLNNTFVEADNNKKNNVTLYIKTFNDVFESIKNNGFDESKTVIPLSQHNCILNGSHRVASAIYLNKKVSCVKIDIDNLVVDYKLFKNRGVSKQTLDMIANTFVEYAKNIYIAFIFPVVNLKDSNIQELIPNIVYQKKLKLNFNGMHNIISQMYFNEYCMNSEFAIGSATYRFKYKELLKTVVFQENSLEDVVTLKNKIISLYNLDKNSIYITNTKEEAKHIARIILNDNSIHFLNYGKPKTYKNINKNLYLYKKFAYENNINTKDIVLDNGTVLATYGIRNSSCIDYHLNNKYDCNYHDTELMYHNKTKEELIYNQKYFFYFNEIKFIALHQIYVMKKNRNENKDINDIKLIKNVLDNNFIIKKIDVIRCNFFYIRTKIMLVYIVPFISDLLKNSKIYYFVRMLYRKYLKEKI